MRVLLLTVLCLLSTYGQASQSPKDVDAESQAFMAKLDALRDQALTGATPVRLLCLPSLFTKVMKPSVDDVCAVVKRKLQIGGIPVTDAGDKSGAGTLSVMLQATEYDQGGELSFYTYKIGLEYSENVIPVRVITCTSLNLI